MAEGSAEDKHESRKWPVTPEQLLGRRLVGGSDVTREIFPALLILVSSGAVDFTVAQKGLPIKKEFAHRPSDFRLRTDLCRRCGRVIASLAESTN